MDFISVCVDIPWSYWGSAAKPRTSAVKSRRGFQIERKHQHAASTELHVRHLQTPPFLDKLSLQWKEKPSIFLKAPVHLPPVPFMLHLLAWG